MSPKAISPPAHEHHLSSPKPLLNSDLRTAAHRLAFPIRRRETVQEKPFQTHLKPFKAISDPPKPACPVLFVGKRWGLDCPAPGASDERLFPTLLCPKNGAPGRDNRLVTPAGRTPSARAPGLSAGRFWRRWFPRMDGSARGAPCDRPGRTAAGRRSAPCSQPVWDGPGR